jgi:hypothetical protein
MPTGIATAGGSVFRDIKRFRAAEGEIIITINTMNLIGCIVQFSPKDLTPPGI